MNIEVSELSKQFKQLGAKGKKYLTFMVFVGFLLLYTFLVFRISTFITATPTEDALAEQLQTVQRPRVDQSTLNTIKQLQDQNIQVQSIFDDARDNPFVE